MAKVDHAGYSAVQINSKDFKVANTTPTLFAGLIINDGNAKTVHVYNGTTLADQEIMTLDAPAKGLFTLDVPVLLMKGLTVSCLSASQVTILYKPDPDFTN